MGENGSTGGTALVDVGELSLRDLDGIGGSAIAEALRTVLDPREAGAEVVASFVNDPERPPLARSRSGVGPEEILSSGGTA